MAKMTVLAYESKEEDKYIVQIAEDSQDEDAICMFFEAEEDQLTYTELRSIAIGAWETGEAPTDDEGEELVVKIANQVPVMIVNVIIE